MKEKYFIISITLILLYIFLIKFCIKIIIYTNVIHGFLILIITFLINVSIAIFFLRLNCDEKILKKVFFTTLIFNFFLICFFLVLSIKKQSLNINISILLTIFCMGICEIFITGNWILPILFVIIKKTILLHCNRNVKLS